MTNYPPRITHEWSANGRNWRSVSYWVGAGWTAGFLQYQLPNGEWMGY